MTHNEIKHIVDGVIGTVAAAGIVFILLGLAGGWV
jgi:hypothetical protein